MIHKKKYKGFRGFTLIEIIGTIVILGIIVLISFATYTYSIKGFKSNYYVNEVKSFVKVGVEFFDENRNYRPTKILNAQEVLLSTLESQSYIDKVADYNGDSCNADSYVLVVKEGPDKYSYHGCLICEKDGYDNTKEDIYCDKTWLDPSKVEYGIGIIEKAYIYKGTSKEDLKNELELPVSYIRKDNNGNVLAERRGTKEGNKTLFPINMDVVDTGTLGVYTVKYQYQDEEQTREVEVYENEAPTVSYKKETTVATSLQGDTSTSIDNYTSGEWAQNVIVKLNSKTFKEPGVRSSKYQWNVDGLWQDFCDTDPCEKKVTRELNQSVQFRLVDSKGHISLVTDGITMKIDNTKPRCGLSIPTTIGSNSWYKTDVNVIFGEKLDQKTTNDNNLVSGVKKYNIQKSTVALARDKTIDSITHKEDTASVKYIGYVEDEAKNFATCEITFKKDATAPTCTNSGDSTSWTKNDRTISYGCNDTLSACDTSYSGGSRTFNTTTKTSTIAAYTIKDKAGNQATCQARDANVYVDKTVPSCTNSGDSTTWTSGDRTIYFGCSDSDSGCDTSYSGGNKKFTTTTQTSSIAAYTIKDKAGNSTTCVARTANVYVDKTAPTCTNSGDSTTWTKNDRTIYYGCSDSNSGCDTSYSGGSRKFTTTTTTSTIAAYTIKDKAGNERTCQARNANVYVDKTAPTCTNSGDSTSWTNGNRTIYYGCSDSNSGCDTSYSGGNKTFSTTTTTSTIAAYTIKDKVGNQTSCGARTANVYVDKTAPTCTNSGDSTTWTTNNRTIYYGCSDSNSGCDTSYSGGNRVFSTTTKTASIAAYTIKDKAGNQATCQARTANVYVGKPTTCGAGTYMNKLSCSGCESGYYCPGGTYNPNDTVQGRYACPSGTTSNANASSCYNLCQQTEKEAICGGYCSDSEITYYLNSNQTVTSASPWIYSDPNITVNIPEGKCIIMTHPNNETVCYVFQHFRVCDTGVTVNIAGSVWYSQWYNSYGMQDGYNRLYVNAHFRFQMKPHCANYFAMPASPKC